MAASSNGRVPGGWAAGGCAFAGGGFVAAAVALTIVISGGVRDALFGGGGTPVRCPHRAPARSTIRGSLRVGRGEFARARDARDPQQRDDGRRRCRRDGARAGGGCPGRLLRVQRGTPRQARLIADARQPAVADAGGRQSDRRARPSSRAASSRARASTYRGPSSYASFSLQVPSGRLAHLIATLSSLASVRALNQSTQDITSPYQRENALLDPAPGDARGAAHAARRRGQRRRRNEAAQADRRAQPPHRNRARDDRAPAPRGEQRHAVGPTSWSAPPPRTRSARGRPADARLPRRAARARGDPRDRARRARDRCCRSRSARWRSGGRRDLRQRARERAIRAA